MADSEVRRRVSRSTAVIALLPVRRCLTALTAAAARSAVTANALIGLWRNRAHATGSVVQLGVAQAPDVVAAAVKSTLPAAAAAAQLDNLGVRLSSLGRWEDALAATAEAVQTYRRLAPANPAFEPELARTLANLGVRLSTVGRWEEAVMATTEAVQVTRRLAAVDCTAFEPDLAGSLTNLSVMLADLGLQREALTASTQAVEIRRRLVAINRTAFEPGLAMALNNLSVVLSNLGRRVDALAASTQAVEVYQGLAAGDPAAFEPCLARSLTNLGADLSDLGRLHDALTATTQAVDIRRRLAAAGTAAFEPDLARGLWVFARVRAAGRVELPQALTAGQESVVLFERLFQQWPRAFSGDLRGARATVAELHHLYQHDEL